MKKRLLLSLSNQAVTITNALYNEALSLGVTIKTKIIM